VKTKKNPKKIAKDRLPLSEVIQKFEKKKKRVKIIYSICIIFLLLIIFLLFGPLKVPLFSQLGDNILGREQRDLAQVEEVSKEVVDIDEISEEEELIEMEEDTESDPLEEKEKSSSGTTATKNTSCTQSNIDYYLENFCYWIKEGDGNKAAEWGKSLNSCGITGFLDKCYSSATVSETIEPTPLPPAAPSPPPVEPPKEDQNIEQEKKERAFIVGVLGAIAFENGLYGYRPLSMSNYAANDGIYFSYIGDRLGSARSTKYGNYYVNFIGDKVSSINNYAYENTYYSFIGEKISSANTIGLGYTFYNFIGDKLGSSVNNTNNISLYYHYIGDRLSSVSSVSFGTYYIN